MSAATLDRAPIQRYTAAGTGSITTTRLINSEWIKFRTLRSSWYTLLTGVLALIAIGGVIGYNTGKNFTGLAPEDAAPSSVLQGYFLAQLLIAVLGVLFVSGEYSTGMIRSTLAAVPKRVPVLVAKAVVFGGVALVMMVTASIVTFFTAQLFLSSYGHGVSLGDPGVLRVVIGTGIYLTLVGLFGSALGWIVRSTAGGIGAVVAIFLVLPGLLGLVPGVKSLVKFMPSEAGGSFAQSLLAPDRLSAWSGLAVMTAEVLLALVVAAVLLRRRDA